MSKKIIRAAVIGVGNMGRHHARIYRQLEDEGKGVQLVGVCDVDRDRAQEIGNLYCCPFYQQVSDLFQNQKVDLVSIAVPTPLHKQVVLAVAPFRPNVLLEKPIAHNLADARVIVRVAKKMNRLFAIGHVERFNPVVEKLKSIIDDGDLGEISSLVARRVGVAPPKNKEVGVLVDLAIHEIDIFYHLLGKMPRRIMAHKRLHLGKKGEDSASIFLDYGPCAGFIHANWITPIKIRLLQVTGTKGYAELNYLTQELITYHHPSSLSLTEPVGTFRASLKYEPRKLRHHLVREEPLKMEVLDIIKCIKKDLPPRVGVEDAYRVLRVVSNCRRACAEP